MRHSAGFYLKSEIGHTGVKYQQSLIQKICVQLEKVHMS